MIDSTYPPVGAHSVGDPDPVGAHSVGDRSRSELPQRHATQTPQQEAQS